MTTKKKPKKKLRLNNEQKTFIVQRLACYDSPHEVSEAVKEVHGIDLAPQNCQAYDPDKYAGKSLSKQWTDLFRLTRAAFLKNCEENIPESNRAVRVRELAKAARAFKQRKNYIGMADMLERIAKELGNVHTNKRELTGDKGKPIQFQDMTNEQLDGRLTALLSLSGALDEGNSDAGNGSEPTIN